ncbi:Long chain acyl-CoA synthetase 4 [Glycine soja]
MNSSRVNQNHGHLNSYIADLQGVKCGIYGANSAEWIMSMQVHFIFEFASLVFCLLHAVNSNGVGAIEFIICHSEVSIALAKEKKIPEDVYISYLPLAHTFFRTIEEIFIWHGASNGFWRGDVKLLIDDVGQLKPTIFCVVPRVLDRVYSGLTQKISSGGFLRKTLKKDSRISFYVYYYFQNSKRKTDLNCNYVYV